MANDSISVGTVNLDGGVKAIMHSASDVNILENIGENG
jgi:hypothetical protein